MAYNLKRFVWWLVVSFTLTSCLDSSEHTQPDAAEAIDASIDASIDAPSYPSCTSLGCSDEATIDKVCADKGICYCGGTKTSLGQRCCVAGIECAP